MDSTLMGSSSARSCPHGSLRGGPFLLFELLLALLPALLTLLLEFVQLGALLRRQHVIERGVHTGTAQFQFSLGLSILRQQRAGLFLVEVPAHDLITNLLAGGFDLVTVGLHALHLCLARGSQLL